MKTTPISITEWPTKTLLSRQEASNILGIGLSTLDSLIPYSELPRTVIHKRVFIYRNDLANYIAACRVSSINKEVRNDRTVD